MEAKEEAKGEHIVKANVRLIPFFKRKLIKKK